MSILALVPARGGSKGVPGKNIKKLNGLPLIAYTVATAKRASTLSSVVVSTDSTEIARVAEAYGADVPFIRPEHLATDHASGIDVAIHAIEFFEKKGIYYEHLILLQPTSPLRDEQDINESVKLYMDSRCDSVISVCESQVHPFLYKVIDEKGTLQDFIEIKEKHMRRQDMPKVYHLNGAIYITSTRGLKERRSFYGDTVLPYVMDPLKSVDIDTEIDFKLAEIILKERTNTR